MAVVAVSIVFCVSARAERLDAVRRKPRRKIRRITSAGVPAASGKCLAVALVASATLAVASGVRAQSPRQAVVHNSPDAFLHKPVYSTDELLAALRNDPALLKQYARHYGVAPQKVLDFIRHALIVYPLPKGRWVTNYGIRHQTGQIYSARTFLPAGTPVWATRSGLPIFKWACANPLTRELPGTLLPEPPRTARTSFIFPQNVPDVGEVPAAPLAVDELPDDSTALLFAPVVSPPTQLDTTLSLPGSLSSPAAFVSGGSKLPGALALLPLLLAAGVSPNGSASTTTPPPSGGSPPPAIPESSTGLSSGLLLGVSGLLWTRRRRPALSAKSG